VDHFIVPSQSVVEVAEEWSGIAPSCVEVVPNPVDVSRLSGIVPQSFEQRPLPIGFIGRLDPIKRLPDLLEATKLLGDRVHLDVFGAGEQEALIRRRIEELAITARVTMHGAVPSAGHALPQMAVLVLPSQAEGFGIVLVEAMAAGVPVVATNVPGIRDVVTHEETGLLVPVGSPEAIAAAISRLVDEPEMRQRLVAAGKTHAQRRYGTPEVVKEYRRIIGL
jgi:2-deoxystreptamine N-acetyl-D-glucosaminyltransferase/2-deoxystreptamine glucosyltransferase